MYKIIGADGQQYGPVSAEEVRQWIAEGRLGAESLVQAEGAADWQPLSGVAEFAAALAVHARPAPPPSAPASVLPPRTADFAGRDAPLDIGGCLTRGWNLFKDHLGLLLGGLAVYLGIEIGIGVLGMIPIIGALFSLANIFVVGPLLGGLFYLFLRVVRGQSATVGDVFAGFRLCYLQLFLGQLVPGLLAGLCLIPAVVTALVALLPSLMRNQPPGPGAILLAVLVGLICLAPMVFLQVNWLFTLPLIIDQRLEFWPAMQASWKTVIAQWWRVFALALLVGLINLAGLLLCCVGVLFTAPIGIAALMYAYESLCAPGRTPDA